MDHSVKCISSSLKIEYDQPFNRYQISRQPNHSILVKQPLSISHSLKKEGLGYVSWSLELHGKVAFNSFKDFFVLSKHGLAGRKSRSYLSAPLASS
jgi:hypothetical protein